jgi:hypothetical protein
VESKKRSSKKQPSEAVKLASAGKLTPETAEPLWRQACAGLPKGERPPFRQVTFTLHDRQWAILQKAIKLAKAGKKFGKLNANSNGNAIARISSEWLRQRRQAATGSAD